MRTWSRQSGVVASAVLIVALAACGSGSTGTGPSAPPTAAQLAVDFDTIYSALNAAGATAYAASFPDTAQADSEAAITIAQYAESGPANGGTETSFTATTTGGNATWDGVVQVSTVNSNVDTVYWVALYPHLNLDTMVIAGIEMSNGSLVGNVAFGSTNQFVSYVVGTTAGSAEVTATGAACSLQGGLAAATVISDWVGTTSTTCTSATVMMSLSVTFQDNGLGSVSVVMLSNQTFHGPLFVPTGGSHVVGIPSKAQAAAEALDALIRRR
jgi:hypothetical protein